MVAAAGEKLQAAQVAEDLELLANFVVDVGAVRMELGERAGPGADIRKKATCFSPIAILL